VSKRKIYFRADAGTEIGYGHFVRTLALADMLKDDFECAFVTQTPTEYQKAEVAKVCELIALPATEEKFGLFLEMLQGNEIVVLDNYFYDTDYQRQIKAKGCKLVCIDDIHDKHYVADVVINHTPGISVSSFSTEIYTKVCLGADYLLMRRPFRESCNEVPQKPYTDKNSVFVCFGGADEWGLTLQVSHILSRHTNMQIHAVVGNSFVIPENELEHTQIILYKNLSAEEMVSVIKKCTLAIVPASSVFFEVCCVRKPVISGYYVDNQIEVAKFIELTGLGVNCGNLLSNLEDKMIRQLSLLNSGLIEKMLNKQKEIINDSSDHLISMFLDL